MININSKRIGVISNQICQWKWLTQQRWERWKARQTDKSHQFATDERADEECGDTKEVASWKTLVLSDGPHRSEKDSG